MINNNECPRFKLCDEFQENETRKTISNFKKIQFFSRKFEKNVLGEPIISQYSVNVSSKYFKLLASPREDSGD